ncbi:ATP-dependent zinc metalloprotease FtsH [Intestinimonas butyriciproducens]|uniref:ATP-dependent zinc metalloprotease FtsH n=1 Tax=Intestinimonas butyriciproducens TaxID=1297617 RepID=UPI001955F82E|nr:ATP-dependent zinc metalloprotease FtsH [Intestinimonas butyriciproducens]MBM6974628.1 ATP-dependent metallopeptidase FtsH/Yme1/Tma family protein [Intestinimonas butyriciproducens]
MMGIVYIIIWALIITLVINYFTSSISTSRSTQIEYSQFVEMVENNEVAWVVMESNKYTIYPRPDSTQADQSQTPAARPNADATVTPIPGLEGLEGLTGGTSGITSPATSDVAGTQLPETGSNEWKQMLKEGPSYYCAPITSDTEMSRLISIMEENDVIYGPPYIEQLSPVITLLISYVLPVVIMVVLFSFLFRGMSSKMGGGLGGLGKSNAKVYVEKSTGVTFMDVAGQDEAKESMQEIIDILHNPQKYTEIGAKLPKGALLVGPPGTGKTLLAKAVAGEANVPFFSISGSDFVEMFVGMGAARVRDLFKEASKMAPCIIFIDEIDTIGKSRDNRLGGNDEREQTLNQLLAELDGFDPSKGVIVLGATNRPEVLDKALLRPGRFDRRITIDRPNLAGRLATLHVHTRKIKLAEDVDLKKIALATAGTVGADLANLVNEAALRAVRMGRKAVNQEDLLASFEFVIAGSEKKNSVLTEFEKKLVAYHEVGHAMVAYKQKNAEPVQKITIVPHTEGSLGYTLLMPEEDKTNLRTKDELMAKITVSMGGRAAEEVVLNTMTNGASQDIQEATNIARNMVAMYGMSDAFGMMALGSVRNQYLDGGYGLDCAQDTAAAMDREVQAILTKCYQDAVSLIRDNLEDMHKVVKYLLEKETITGGEMVAIIEGRDPALVEDAYASTRDTKTASPALDGDVEPPAKKIHIFDGSQDQEAGQSPSTDADDSTPPQTDLPAEEPQRPQDQNDQ